MSLTPADPHSAHGGGAADQAALATLSAIMALGPGQQRHGLQCQ